MYIEQLYTSCLAEAAYYIESDGVAAIIDPIRDTEVYLDIARKRGCTIKYVFETHFHADFVSGHLDLAKATGAEIVFGTGANPGYNALIAEDGQTLEIGKVRVKVLHTPGHTPESVCYLLFDESNEPHALFSGDTLFIGDVGRPDLAVKSELTKEDLAGMLYDSLRNKIMTLPDHVLLYPAHGAGSACGKNISKERSSTIGQQKQLNYALQPITKEAFIKAVTEGLTPPPAYFFYDASINKSGYQMLDSVLEKGTVEFDPEEFKRMADGGMTILDTRAPDQFAREHIPGSLNIGLDGQFAIWAATLLDPKAPVLLIAEGGRERESVVRLARVGLENVAGLLKGDLQNWRAQGYETTEIPCIDPAPFVTRMQDLSVLDVRNTGEWNTGIIEQAQLIPLGELESRTSELDESKTWYIHCAGGYRSMIASSILSRKGFQVVNVNGGMSKLREVQIPLSVPVTA